MTFEEDVRLTLTKASENNREDEDVALALVRVVHRHAATVSADEMCGILHRLNEEG